METNTAIDDSKLAEYEAAQDAAERANAIEQAHADCGKRFPPRYRNAATEHPDVLAWLNARHNNPTDPPSLLLLGPTGTGKTYQAYGALRHVATAVTKARYTGYITPSWDAMTFADFTASMRPNRYIDAEPEEVLKRYRNRTMLLLDDLGAAKASEWVEEVTYRLINGRYEDMKACIFTSNLELKQLKDNIGDRIASRLAETCMRVVLAGPDRRRVAA